MIRVHRQYSRSEYLSGRYHMPPPQMHAGSAANSVYRLQYIATVVARNVNEATRIGDGHLRCYYAGWLKSEHHDVRIRVAFRVVEAMPDTMDQ